MQQPRPMFCLLVEGNPSVGLNLAETLDAYGHFVAGPFPSQAQACRWLERFTPDLAILAPALQDEPASPIVLELQARSIPFIFHHAAEADPTTMGSLAGVHWVEYLNAAAPMRTDRTARPSHDQGRKRDSVLCCSAAKSALSRPKKSRRTEVAHTRANAA